MIDLHIHSSNSDGELSAEKLVLYLKEVGITGFSLTDHDTFGEITEASEIARKNALEFIPGIEFSTQSLELGLAPHILGYFSELDKKITEFVKGILSTRVNRVRKICQNSLDNPVQINGEKISVSFSEVQVFFNKEYPITASEVFAVLQYKIEKLTGTFFRGHDIAYIFLGRPEKWEEYRDFFEKYKTDIVKGERRWFVEKKQIPDVFEIISLINNSGGVAVLAHPNDVVTGSKNGRITIKEKDLKEMILSGLSGIECYTPYLTKGEIKEFLTYAKKYNLLVTAGTDFHGPSINKGIMPGRYGDNFFPEECFSNLLQKL